MQNHETVILEAVVNSKDKNEVKLTQTADGVFNLTHNGEKIYSGFVAAYSLGKFLEIVNELVKGIKI